SEELQEVVNVVVEKLIGLDIKLDTVCIHIFKENSQDLNLWIAAPGLNYVSSFHLPATDSPLHTDIFKAREEGLSFLTRIYTREEKNSFHDWAFENTDFKNIPDVKRKLI